MRITACKTCEASGDVDYMEAFERPAVEVPAIIQPGDKDPIERSTTSSPSSPQPEGCPLTQPEDDGSDSSESEMPVLFVLPDTTVIVYAKRRHDAGGLRCHPRRGDRSQDHARTSKQSFVARDGHLQRVPGRSRHYNIDGLAEGSSPTPSVGIEMNIEYNRCRNEHYNRCRNITVVETNFVETNIITVVET